MITCPHLLIDYDGAAARTGSTTVEGYGYCCACCGESLPCGRSGVASLGRLRWRCYSFHGSTTVEDYGCCCCGSSLPCGRSVKFWIHHSFISFDSFRFSWFCGDWSTTVEGCGCCCGNILGDYVGVIYFAMLNFYVWSTTVEGYGWCCYGVSLSCWWGGDTSLLLLYIFLSIICNVSCYFGVNDNFVMNFISVLLIHKPVVGSSQLSEGSVSPAQRHQ